MLAPQNSTVIYPETDGKPMAETDVHRDLLLRMVDLLKNAFPNAYVSGNICLYYEQGNPKKMISPDSLLCRSQPPAQKRIYRAWTEHAQLDLVMEFSSFGTKRIDHSKKKQIYEQILKVPYYVIFDPHAVYLNVFALKEGHYQLIEAEVEGRCFLTNLGIQIAIENGNSLRLFDMQGSPILTGEEREAQRAEQEAQRAEQEAQRAEQEAQKTMRLEQELRQQKEQADEEKQGLLQEIEQLRQQLKVSH